MEKSVDLPEAYWDALDNLATNFKKSRDEVIGKALFDDPIISGFIKLGSSKNRIEFNAKPDSK